MGGGGEYRHVPAYPAHFLNGAVALLGVSRVRQMEGRKCDSGDEMLAAATYQGFLSSFRHRIMGPLFGPLLWQVFH